MNNEIECDINDLTYKQQVFDIINNLELNNETDKNILKSRFLGEVLTYEIVEIIQKNIIMYLDF